MVKEQFRKILYSGRFTNRLMQKRAKFIYLHREKKKYIYDLKKQMKDLPNAAILVMTPVHGNMGDHAIAIAEKEMLKRLKIDCIEVTAHHVWRLKGMNRMGILNGRTVLIHGGGYLGTLWYEAESLLRDIIIENPDSFFLGFPNTIYYEDSQWGRNELKKSIRIFNHHKHLKLYAREKYSYHKMRKIYNDVSIAPDMVMSIDKSGSNTVRSGCMLCLRKDHERTRTLEDEQHLRKIVTKLFGDNVRESDMIVYSSHPIEVENRIEELEKKFNEFKASELVITDRLHGMIFSAVTGTPCILISSLSPKIRGCYEWLKELEYIQIAENANEIEAIYEHMPKGSFLYDKSVLASFYGELEKDLRNIIKR